MYSRIEPMNQDATFSPARGKRFSLSPGERAGVRASVKLNITGAYNSQDARWCRHLTLGFTVRGEGMSAP